MYKEFEFNEFFSNENQENILTYKRKFAVSLISPNQVVHVAPTDDSVNSHLELILSIICDIYNISKPVRQYYYVYINNLMSLVNQHMKVNERNFVIIRYILTRNKRIAYVEYPYYISPYEYERMREIDELFKQYKIESHALIHKYDPINNEELIGKAIQFEKRFCKSAIKKSLDYIQEHNLISNYELNAPKEYVLK